MSKKRYVYLIITTIVITWIFGTYQRNREFRQEEGLVFSPKHTRSYQILDSPNSAQLLIYFHNHFVSGGGNVISIRGDSVSIEANWIDDNNIEIHYPKEATISSREEVAKFYKDSVFIKYYAE